MKHYDVVVIGGGVIGLSVAYGLAKKNVKVLVLDEGNQAFRASRSNFGLVWFQGKGQGNQDYVEWTRESAKSWSEFADEIRDSSGISTDYRLTGGLALCVGEEGLSKRRQQINTLISQSSSGSYECEFLSRSELKEVFGDFQLGEELVGATYSQIDGHVNPLSLLHALQKIISNVGGDYLGGHKVKDLIPSKTGGFKVLANGVVAGCDKVFIAAGLGTEALAKKVGINMPIIPERGQILVTQPTEQVFPLAMSRFRQTENGTIMLGASNEDVGLNDSTSVEVTASIAKSAVKVFPQLKKLNLVRTWAGLRIQSPDKYPVYGKSTEYPGAYAAICHSGITLAPIHTKYLSDWIISGNSARGIEQFNSERFSV